MNITTKFNPGEKAFIIQSESKRTTSICDACHGMKKVTLGNHEIECPICRGEGNIKNKARRFHTVLPITIDLVTAESDSMYSPPQIKYFLENESNDYFYEEKELFKNREDADKECERRNSR